ncbi:hypothetical protein [Paenibacillus macerans]|uniref:hypothetical protein n=1 Tax=Paenibacillus macerans TaxID=44252 RepID=UPI003D3243A7
MLIIKYETEEEAEQIIYEKQKDGFTLVEVSNITEGNFLGFQEPGWTPPTPEETLFDKLTALEQSDAENKQAIADLTMSMAAMMAE